MPLTSEDKIQYKALYLQTAKPYVSQMISILQELKSGQENTDKLEEIHRAAHSLASQSQMMGYASTGELSRLIEAILKAKIDNTLELREEVLDALINAVNQISASVVEIETNDKELDLSKESETLQSLSNIHV